jgi:Na+/phosphate symporter
MELSGAFGFLFKEKGSKLRRMGRFLYFLDDLNLGLGMISEVVQNLTDSNSFADSSIDKDADS